MGTMGCMCRYGISTYRTHFVCVPCRASRKEWPRPVGSPQVRCHGCGAAMVDAGYDVHIPRRADLREWGKLGLLLADGTRFSGCGCNGPGPMPATVASAKSALAARARAVEAEREQFPVRAALRARHAARRGRTPTFGRARRAA